MNIPTYNPILSVIKEQDKQLEILESGLDRLKVQSYSINEEIKLQTLSLDKFHNDISKSDDKITNINGHLKKIISRVDKCSNIYYVIGCLIIIFIILLLVVIYS